MLSRKRILENLVSFLTLSFLTVLGFGVASGQTKSTAAATQVAEVGSIETRGTPSAKIPATKREPEVKPAANPLEAEAALMNAKSGSPKKTNPAPSAAQVPPPCPRTVNANVVALPQPIMLNRLGAAIPDGLVFALMSDTIATVSGANTQYQLKPDKRPRPLVLRANVGDCLRVRLTNGIPTNKFTNTTVGGATTGTTEVSLHVEGMEWVTGAKDDGSYVGTNDSSLASAPPPPAPEWRSTDARTFRRSERAAGGRGMVPQPGHCRRSFARNLQRQ